MRLMVITDSEFPYTYGGIETHIYYLTRSLLKISKDIKITLLVKSSQGKKYYSGVETSCHIIKAGLPPKDFSRSFVTSVYHWVAVVIFNLHTFLKLLTLKTDVIHYHYGTHTYGGWYLLLLRFLRRVPIITTFHTLGIKNEYKSTSDKTPRLYLAYLLGGLIERSLFLASNSVITFFPSGIKNGVCIPQGIDLNKFKFIERNDYYRFVYIGRLDPQKSVMGILSAFGQIYHDFPGELVLIGDGSQLDEIQNFVTENFDNQRVRILGAMSAVNEELSKGGILVLFSQYEGFSLSTLEAMATGLPTILTPVGANRFYFEDGKHTLFVTPGDVHDLAKKMLAYYHDKEMADEIRQRAYRLVKDNFDWHNIACKTLELYQQAVVSRERGKNDFS